MSLWKVSDNTSKPPYLDVYKQNADFEKISFGNTFNIPDKVQTWYLSYLGWNQNIARGKLVDH